MKYIYGPVPSRRLGSSLGVDLVPFKVCTLDCIYCQLGRTTRKTIKREPHAGKDALIAELKKVLTRRHRIDFITFSGSGEPTLDSEIGLLIKEVKKNTSIPVAVLTNGTLLYREDVQKDLMEAQVVIPSLDAASREMFQKINRPHRSLNIQSIINGIKKFRQYYTGQIWLEIMFIKNFNDSPDELSRIKKAISEIQSDKVHLNTVVRPPSEIYAEQLSSNEMEAVKKFLDKRCEVIAESQKKRSREVQDVEGSIIEMTKRRPLTVTDIANVLGISEANAESIIRRLKADGTVTEKRYGNRQYYISPGKRKAG